MGTEQYKEGSTKMKINEIITEALTPQQVKDLYKQLGKKWDKNIHDNIFKGKDRIYIPFKATGEPVKASAIQDRISSDLKSVGYQIDDYKQGIAVKIDDPRRKIKIGRLIKDQQVLNQFANDPARAGAKQSELEVVISRDPLDVAGMSTDRGWTSCMDLNGGINKKYVPTEVKNGAIIMYLIKSTDKNIENPMARILLKPFLYKSHMILAKDQLYGTAPREFEKMAQKFCDWANSGSPSATYELARGSYDNMRGYYLQHLSPEALANIHSQPKDVKLKVAQDRHSPLTALQLLADEKGEPEILRALAMNPESTDEMLIKLADYNIQQVNLVLPMNNNCPVSVLTKLATSPIEDVRDLVSEHYNITPEILDILSNDRVYQIRTNVASHYTTAPSTLLKLANDPHVVVRLHVSGNVNTPPEGLRLIFDHPTKIGGENTHLARNKNTPDDILEKMIKASIKVNNRNLETIARQTLFNKQQAAKAKVRDYEYED